MQDRDSVLRKTRIAPEKRERGRCKSKRDGDPIEFAVGLLPLIMSPTT